MQTKIINNTKENKLSYCNIQILQHFIFFTILMGLFYLYRINGYIFHSVAEIFSCIIAGGVFMISFSTYKITNNNFFMFLGIGYLFVLTLDVFHLVTFDNILSSYGFVYDIDTRFWIAARFLELLTYFFSFMYLFKENKRINFYMLFFVYYFITLFIFLDITSFHILIPPMRLESSGMTAIKIYLEYFMSMGFLACTLILYLAKNKIDKSLYAFLQISLFLKVITELFFTMYINANDIYIAIGHVLKVVSYYTLYMGVIYNGLDRPFDMIKKELTSSDNSIKEKDIQRRYLEEIFHQNELCYNWIIDNSSSGIAIVRNDKILYVNDTIVNMLGAKDVHDLLGIDAKNYLFDSSYNKEDFYKEVNSTRFNEMKLLKLNKETIDIEYTINNITYRGNPAYLILLKDIRYKKEINNLKNILLENKIELNKSNEFNKVLTEFFSNISHDLKTPINVILSAVQLLMLKQNDMDTSTVEFNEQLSRLALTIKQNGYRLIRLVNNLIDVSKYESGFLKLNLKNYNIISIIEDITTSVSDYIKSKEVNIIFDTDVEERYVAVDADKIERVMLNLLSNAVKFTDKGGYIFVNIEDYDEVVRIVVKDTGVGIKEEKLNDIFDRFSQIDETLIRNKEGSGIGLSLVKSLIQMHDGTIMVNSKIGEGSEFIIELPVRLIDNCELSENISMNNNIEKILVEFSDIYSIS